MRRAFTLIEVVAVSVILAILAVSVIPAFDTVDAARRTAAADEIARLMTVIRAHTMATGDAAGISIDGDTLTPIRIDSTGVATEPIPGPLGSVRPTLDIAAAFPGVEITGVTLGDGSTADGTIWFGYDGTPRLRDANLNDTGPATEDTVIVVTGGERVRFRRLSGSIGTEDAP